MAQPVYKVWFMKYKEPWYQLTQEEQNQFMAQIQASLQQVGSEMVTLCASVWADEKWIAWGVEKYPDMEALQKHTQNLFNMNWFRYVESKSYLGSEFPQT